MPDLTPARRTLVKGAAWTLPTVAVASAAPALAASPCAARTCPVDISFGAPTGGDPSATTTASWSSSTSGTLAATASPNGRSKGPGFRTRDPLENPAAGTWFGVGWEARSGTVTVTATRTVPVTLTAGCPYRFTTLASYYRGQSALTMRVNVGSNPVLTWSVPAGSLGTGSETVSADFMVPTTGRYTVTISMTLANSGTNGNNNDLYINNPEILCV